MIFKEQQKLKLWWLYILLRVGVIIISSIVWILGISLSFQHLKENYFIPILAALLPFVMVYITANCRLFIAVGATSMSYRYAMFSNIFNDNNIKMQLDLKNNKRLLFSTTNVDELHLF